jgi:cyclin-dependent kinase 7
MDRYDRGVVLGRGTFGSVFKAVDKQTGASVAIKRIDAGASGASAQGGRGGLDMTALREVKLLRELKPHPNVVPLLDVFLHKRRLCLVFDFVDSDLEAVIRAKGLVLSPGDVKAYAQALLRALAFCHASWVLHRDVKPNNLLVGADGEVGEGDGGRVSSSCSAETPAHPTTRPALSPSLTATANNNNPKITGSIKLADFGLARVHGSPDNRRLSPNVFARWYRAPELLLGATRYGASADVWGAGMVLAELLLRRPWMPANGDVEQLSMIFGALGLPDTANGGANAGPGGPWPGAADLPAWVPFRPPGAPPPPLSAQFPGAPADALDLLGRMLALDPARRPSAQQCLEHPYFASNAPPPTPPERLPRPPAREDNPLQRAPGPAGAGGAAPAAAAATAAAVERPSKVARAAGDGSAAGVAAAAAAAAGAGAASPAG